jgi:16S rRNA (guanine527-N7)-methyltransferase
MPLGDKDGPDAVRRFLNASDETMTRLEAFVALLVKWQSHINLVGRDTLSQIWVRHILDSAQLLPLIPTGAQRLADLGSGAGFPGLILALLGAPDVHLIESDSRKAAFLSEAARITQTPITLHVARIEQVEPLAADTVTARALAPLDRLLPLATIHGHANTQYLFLKGRTADDELTAVRKDWMIACDRIRSQTDASGQILHLKEVRRGQA